MPTRRNLLADAVDFARESLLALRETAVGEYLGLTYEDEVDGVAVAATHRFAATLPGYRGWQWAVVVAAAPDSDRVTVSESALLPGPEALTAPEWVPWERRVRPGDLAPGDLLAPTDHDDRLEPGYVATGDPEVDDVADELGLGRSQVLSREGRTAAAQRWYEGDYGPASDMARAAASTCGLCGFYLPLAGALHAGFGVCGNEYSADGRVVSAEYGCGAHSDTTLPTGAGSPAYAAYDDAAVEVVDVARPAEAPAPLDDKLTAGDGEAEPVDAEQSGTEQQASADDTAERDGAETPEGE